MKHTDDLISELAELTSQYKVDWSEIIDYRPVKRYTLAFDNGDDIYFSVQSKDRDHNLASAIKTFKGMGT